MTDEHEDIGYFERLIQEEIEGTATESELQELEAHIAANPEAAEERAAQHDLAARLESAPLVDPPSWLKDRILSDIRDAGPHAKAGFAKTGQSQAGSTQDGSSQAGPSRAGSSQAGHAAANDERGGGWTALLAPFGFARRPAFAFAFGAVAGMLALAMFTGQGAVEDPRGLSGAMTPIETATSAAVIDRLDIDAGGIQGAAEVTRVGDRVTLEFTLSAPASAEFALRFSPGDLSLTGFERQGSSLEPVILGTDTVSGKGPGVYRITWLAADNTAAPRVSSEVHLEITAAGRTLVRSVKTGS